MYAIHKKIVTDENQRPVAVQMDYEDWSEIERLLEIRGAVKSGGRRGKFQELLEKIRGTWQGGDGLEYQVQLRGWWDDR